MKYLISICITAMVFSSADAQELAIGREMPPVTLQNVWNYNSDSITLASLRGKLVIIDFWDTRCLGCLEGFAEIDRLQSKFKDRVQFLMVSWQPKEFIKEFLSKHKSIKIPNGVPLVCSDTILKMHFPYTELPYHVWISPEGKVQYKLFANETSTWRIAEYLAGDRKYLPPRPTNKKYVTTFIDSTFMPSVKYASYITSYIPGYQIEASSEIPGSLQISYPQGSAIELYVWSYYPDHIKLNFYRPGRLVLNLKDPFKFVRPPSRARGYEEWCSKYQYNYHLVWPEEKRDEFYDIFKSDVTRFFGLNARLGTNNTDAWVLVRKGNIGKLKTKGGATIKSFYTSGIRETRNDSIRFVKNTPFKYFSNLLGVYIEHRLKVPYVDSVNYAGNIDFQIMGYDLDHLAIPTLRKALNQYGLDLVRRKCPIPALIITDKTEGAAPEPGKHLQ